LQKLIVCAFIAGLLLTGAPTSVQSGSAAAVQFGIDIKSLDRASDKGLDFSFGTFWVGAWIETHGWSDAQAQLRAARAHNVTPVINWWYWVRFHRDAAPALVGA
jgi:hypothetical protein